MAVANRYTGKNLFLQWIDASGTVNFAGDQKSFEWDWEADTEDMAAGSDDYHYAYGTLLNIKAKLEIMETGSSGTSVAARLEPLDEGTLIWGPQGSATGKPKWGAALLVKKNSPKYPFDKAVVRSIDFEAKGGLVFNGNSATF